MLKKKKTKLIILIAMLVILIMTTTIILNAGVLATNSIYYVDSVGGNDNNKGTTEASAWRSLAKVNSITFQPGDQILFKAGCSWTGSLHPLGSGANGSPIKIGMYGTGNKPLLNGGGISAVIYFYNQQYWEISNLEITNDDNFSVNSTGVTRCGIDIENYGAGTLNHFVIKNCYIHDVDGDDANKYTANFGIYFRVQWADPVSTFNDITIDNNILQKIDAGGIFTESAWAERPGVYTGWFIGEWHGWTNVIIKNNILDDIGMDGIVTCVCASPIVEYNVVSNFNMRSGTYAAGLWPYNSDNALFQYNEAYGGRTILDGMGFDCDWLCHNTVMQYNYSHDNEGGFMLVCCDGTKSGAPFNTNSVIRYNISQNDKCRVFSFNGPATNTYVYNNDIYLGVGSTTKPVDSYIWGGWAKGINFYNNIFHLVGSGGYNFGSCTNIVFDYNVFYGNHPSTEPSDAHKLTSNPLFVNPGGAGTGRSTCSAYQLQSGSPCIDSGMSIANNGGKDFWGNTLYNGNPDRGAHEYYSGGPTSTPGATPVPTAVPTPTPTSTSTPTPAATPTSTPGNMILNPDFESGEAYWTNLGGSSSVASNPHSGSRSRQITSTGTGFSQQITSGVVANASYTLKCWGKVATANEIGKCGIKCYNSSNQVVGDWILMDFNTTTYTQKSGTIITPSNGVKLEVYGIRNAGSNYVYFDDMELINNSGATPVPTAAPTPTPASTSTPTPAATPTSTPGNMILNPGFESGEAYWTNLGGSSSVAGNPHSGSYSRQITSTGTGFSQQITSGIVVNASYTLKCWGKVAAANEIGKCGIKCYNSSNQVVGDWILMDFNTTIYTQKSGTITIPSGGVKLEVYGIRNAGSNYVYFDDMELYKN